MIRLELRRVAEYTRRAKTEDLLDRVTVYREGMEPVALDLMEGELDRRGITREQIAAHAADRWKCAIPLPDGTALRCSFCDRPAIQSGWGWHRLYGRVPVFPRRLAYCSFHQPDDRKPDTNPPDTAD